jgi:hypothetical protein
MGKPIEELGGRTWDELEVIEHADGQLMFPAVVRRREKTGKVVETKVRVRAPAPDDHFRARVDARKWMLELELDAKADEDLFKQLEQLCLLARAIRVFEDPHPQFAKPSELSKYDETCLQDIQEQINAFKDQLDPREPARTEEELWRVIFAVAREAHIGPLVDIAGRDQGPCVTRMALEACRSPTGQRWQQSFGISIPALSALTSAEPS